MLGTYYACLVLVLNANMYCELFDLVLGSLASLLLCSVRCCAAPQGRQLAAGYAGEQTAVNEQGRAKLSGCICCCRGWQMDV